MESPRDPYKDADLLTNWVSIWKKCEKVRTAHNEGKSHMVMGTYKKDDRDTRTSQGTESDEWS